jgi:phosphoribosylanthranilate isomerase
MPLKSVVKVSHVSNLSDARYCAGMGVEMLGFQAISGHEHYIPAEIFQDIRGWISGPAIIAELYGLSSRAQIETVLNTYAPDYFELTIAEYRKYREELTRPCLVTCTNPTDLQLIKEDDDIRYVITDGAVSCSDLTGKKIPVLARIDSVESLNARLNEGCFRGFVLEAPSQVRPGITNYDQLGAILEALDDEG